MSPKRTWVPLSSLSCSEISRLISGSVSAWLDTRRGPSGRSPCTDVGGQPSVRLRVARCRHVRLQLGSQVVARERDERPQQHEFALAGHLVAEQRVVGNETSGLRLGRELRRRDLLVPDRRRSTTSRPEARRSVPGRPTTPPRAGRSSRAASWYLEYRSVWARNRSSGYRRWSRSSDGISAIGSNRSGNALRHARRIGSSSSAV